VSFKKYVLRHLERDKSTRLDRVSTVRDARDGATRAHARAQHHKPPALLSGWPSSHEPRINTATTRRSSHGVRVAVRAALEIWRRCGWSGGENGGGEGGGEGAAVDAAVHAAAAAVVVEDDVVARAVRGGAAPTQTPAQLPGSPHHGEPRPRRGFGCWRLHLYIGKRRGGAKRASMHFSVARRVGEQPLRRPLRAT